MEEMMDDTLDMDADEEIEEEAEAEVDTILFEMTNGKLGQAGSVGTELPVRFDCLTCIPAFSLTSYPVSARQTGRRGNGKDNGRVSTATQWFTEQLEDVRLEHLIEDNYFLL
jgi:hypothetical protein